MLEPVLTFLRERAPDTVNVPILQPADPFLETAGEDLRRRIFITQDNAGMPQCLRPEFTIPLCLQHIGRGGEARYAYGGTVFRQARAGASEFPQAGLEDLGNPDTAEADAAAIADMLGALAAGGIETATITLGDQNLFGMVVANLGLPERVAARLLRNFGSADHMNILVDRLTSVAGQSHGETEADQLARAGDEEGLLSHVEGLMADAGLSPKSGRGADDIARRMLEKAQESQFRLPPREADLLRTFLEIRVPLCAAAPTLEEFASDAGFSFGSTLALFRQRVDALKRRDIDLGNLTYNAAFGRKLDYYTGLLFEAEVGGVQVGGGGRYDKLCTLLGSDAPVPAVGFSISLDRVGEALT